MDNTKKYIGESPIKENPQKKLKIRLTDGVVTTDKLADKSVTVNKLGEDVQLAIEGIEHAGLFLAQEFGNSTVIGISQKVITDNFNEVFRDLSNAQPKLTFDNTPKANSSNPVKSSGIKEAIDAKADAANTYDKSVLYTKTEVDNIVSAITAYDVAVQVVTSLPSTSSAQTNVIYRLTGESSYSDYAFNGTVFVKLAEYDNLIDDVPTKSSNNLAKSGGIYTNQKFISDTVDDRTLTVGTELCRINSQSSTGGTLDSTTGTLKEQATSSSNYKWTAVALPETISAGDALLVRAQNKSDYYLLHRIAFFTKSEGESVDVGDSFIPGSYSDISIYAGDTTMHHSYVRVPENATHVCISNYYQSTTKNSNTYVYTTKEVHQDIDELNVEVNKIGVEKSFYPNTDFSIGDASGYNIVEFSDGHIQTKAFNSATLFPNGLISQFARIAVIGDSWSSGYFYSVSGGPVHRDNRKFSWIANLARKNGVHWYNFAVGGTTIARWLGKSEATTRYDAETNPTGSSDPRNDSPEGLQALINAPACDLYFVWLGSNERSREHYYMGTIEDAALPQTTRTRTIGKGSTATSITEPDYPDTFYGNTALALWHITNKAPNSKIVFICGNPGTTYTGDTVADGDLNGARLDIINAQSLPRLRPSDDYWYKVNIADKQSAGSLLGDHPDVMDNSAIAMSIERLFGKAVGENQSYFRTYYNADAFGISEKANTDEQ